MKFMFFCIGFFFTLLLGCAVKFPRNHHKSEYKTFYVVDTIKIKDPIRVHSTRFGGEFVISKSILNEYTGKKNFFSRSDVFILENDISRFLPVEDIGNYPYPKESGGCGFAKPNLISSDLEIYEFRNRPSGFIMGLIDANFYYYKSNSYISFSYGERYEGKNFYKVVFPICN